MVEHPVHAQRPGFSVQAPGLHLQRKASLVVKLKVSVSVSIKNKEKKGGGMATGSDVFIV